MFYKQKTSCIIKLCREIFLLIIFMCFCKYSEGQPVHGFNYDFTNNAIVLQQTFFQKLFGSDNSDRFKQKENQILEKIKLGLYAQANEISKIMEQEAIKSKADYWLCLSYYYMGFIAKSQKDYKAALHYFHQIINSESSSFLKDKEKMTKVYIYMADIYKKSDHESEAITYFEKSLELKNKLTNKQILVPAYVNLGSIYSSKNKFAIARECYFSGLALGNGTPDYTTSIIYNNLGNDEYSQGSYSKAIEYYTKSIQISEKINDLNGLALSYNNLGNIYITGLKNPMKAIEYFSRSLEIEKKRENSDGIAWELISIGNVYINLKKFSEAQKSITDALTIFKTSKNVQGISKSLDLLGTMYTSAGNYKMGIITFRECIELRRKNHDTTNLTNVYKNMGGLFYYGKDYRNALGYYFRALELADSAKDKSMISRIYSGIHDAYAGLGQYDKAYQYLKDYSDLKDTLLNATISRQIIDIQEKYEKSKMEQKVAMQNLEIKNKSLQRNGLLAFLALAMIIFSSLLYFIVQKRKNEKLLYLRNTQLKDKEIVNLVQQSEIKSMMSMAEGQENERQRISRELHDRVGSMLSLIKLNLSNHEQEDKPFVAENLSLLENTYQEVRNISHNLHSGLLTRFGLKAALKDLKNTVESHNAIRVNLFFHEEEPALSKETEVIIFKVLQELVTNTLKHANARNLDIQINRNEDETISVSVEDDGKGFDVRSDHHEGIGLQNIRYRISSIGGELDINSSPGKGASFIIHIPVTTSKDKSMVS